MVGIIAYFRSGLAISSYSYHTLHSVANRMKTLYFMLMLFAIGNLAEDSLQLYCGDDKYIKLIKVKKLDFQTISVWVRCVNSEGGTKRAAPIHYTSPGEEK